MIYDNIIKKIKDIPYDLDQKLEDKANIDHNHDSEISDKINEKVGTLDDLETLNKTSIVSAVNEVFQSGVNVKNNMVQAINSKKTVSDVSVNDTWETLTQKVNDIKEGSGNATSEDVLAGKTFTNSDGIEYTGTLNIGGTATAADELAGKTFTDNTKTIKTGTMVNRGGAQTITPGSTNKVLNTGYYSGNITITGNANLIPENIKNGVQIFGVTGKLRTYDIVPGTERTIVNYINTHNTVSKTWVVLTEYTFTEDYGGVRLTTDLWKTNGYSNPYVKIERVRNGVAINTSSEYLCVIGGNTPVIDYTDIRKGDKFVFYGINKASKSDYVAGITSYKIQFSIVLN